jgi:hypothetical protein
MARTFTRHRTSTLLAIVYFFIELCLLRRKPQDLPASAALLAVVLVAGLLGGVLLSVSAGAALLAGVGQTLLDFLLMLGVLHLALKFTDKLPRFLQTATALVGADTLVGIVALVPVGLAGPGLDDSPRLLLAGLLFMALVAWSVVITAHILRHAFDIKLMQGAIAAVAFDIFSFVLVGGLTQGPA